MQRLKNIEVEYISLVSAPANEEQLLLKGGHIAMIEFKKYDEERRVAYGIVYAPERIDSQGDFADRFEIQRAAYAFMKNKRLDNVDVNHSFSGVDGCYVCESWIVKEGDHYFYDKAGAWAVGIKVDDDGVWQMLKEGRLTGLSMAGKAEREAVQKEEGVIKAIIEGIKLVFKGELNKDKEDGQMGDDEIRKAMDDKAAQVSKEIGERLDSAVKELKETYEGFRKSVDERLDALERARQSRADAGEVKKSLAEEIL